MSSILEDRAYQLEYMLKDLSNLKKFRESVYSFQTFGDGLPENMIKDFWKAKAELTKYLSAMIYFNDKYVQDLQGWVDENGGGKLNAG